jgi:hypothetical protein
MDLTTILVVVLVGVVAASSIGTFIRNKRAEREKIGRQ